MATISTETLVLPKLFEVQVEQSPHATALEFEGQSLTYRQLNERVNALASHLKALGTERNQLIGICLHRSLNMVISLLAVLKAGAAYLPIDPTYPRDRVAYMVSNSAAPILLTESSCMGLLPEDSQCQVVVLDQVGEHIYHQYSHANLSKGPEPADVAYTIYTSGSTGKPKGVQIRHGSVANLLQSIAKEPGIAAGDRWLAITSISFDIAVLEIFLPLAVGATVILVSREVAMDGAQLAKAIAQSGATIMQATPATWRLLLAAGWEGQTGLKVLCGGEAMTRDLADLLLERCDQLWNMYGPTETTVWSMVHQVQPGPGPIPIGRAMANTTLHIFAQDDAGQLRPAAVGEPGELYIGGSGVALGYFNRPDLTAERFIANPAIGQSKEQANSWGIDGPVYPGHLKDGRIYKTGDLVRLHQDGILGFIGRVDSQVKIRGFRVELGEVESALQASPDIHAAAAIARPDTSNELQLIGYVVPQPDTPESMSPTTQDSAVQAHVGNWQQLWSDAYDRRIDHQTAQESDPCFDFSGYGDSYTGQLLSATVVQEWVEYTVDRIKALQPKRVLEIGCGKGLLLFRLAPECDRYVGIDVASTALSHIQSHCNHDKEAWQHVALFQSAAHELERIDALDGEQFDTIVINSVIQYFPSASYFLDVLESLRTKLSPGGQIFIGDVRHLGSLSLFHASVQIHKTPLASVEDLQQRLDAKTKADPELIFSPDFFHRLPHYLSGLTRVSQQLKRGHHQSELTDFRYDVVLHFSAEFSPTDTDRPINADRAVQSKDKQARPSDARPSEVQQSAGTIVHDNHQGTTSHIISTFNHEATGDLAAIRDFLQSTQPATWDLYQVPNARLAQHLCDWKSLQHSTHPAKARMNASIESPTDHALNPEALWNLSNELPYQVYLRWSEADPQGGSFDVRFQAKCPHRSTRWTANTENWAARNPSSVEYLNHESIRPLLKPTASNAPWWTDWVQEPATSTSSNVSTHGQTRSLLANLRTFLQAKLPAYMVPTQFVVMDRLPLTPNDKVDRKALPDPEWTQAVTDGPWIAPTTDIEKRLASMWSNLLQIKPISKTDDFMELGGHSLLAAQLITAIRNTFQVHLSLLAILHCSQLEQMAQLIEQQLRHTQRQGSIHPVKHLVADHDDLATDTLEPDFDAMDDGRFSEFIESDDQWVAPKVDRLTPMEHTTQASPKLTDPSVPQSQVIQSQIDQDVLLEEAIANQQGIMSLPKSNTLPQHIFLTGATGLVGGFLLHELLTQTNAQVHCLVRAQDGIEARYKLEQHLQECQMPWQRWGDRIQVLAGDLARPYLGLKPEQFDWLAHHIDSIYHSAAQINLIYPYRILRGTNVKGTVEILRLACTHTLKSVHHLSTLDVLPSQSFENHTPLTESMTLPSWQTLTTGYACTKWVAEKLVSVAHERGIPTQIYRLGMTTGHSVSGYGNPDDMVGRLLRGIVQLQAAPADDFPLSFTPVDRVAKALVAIAHDTGASETEPSTPIFHVAQTETISLQSVISMLRQQGFAIETTTYEDWIERLYLALDNPLYPFLGDLAANGGCPHFFESLNLSGVSNAQLTQRLKHQNIDWGSFTGDMLQNYIAHLVRHGYLPVTSPILSPTV